MRIIKIKLLILLGISFAFLTESFSQGTIIPRPAGTTDAPWGFMEYLPVDYNDDPTKLFPLIIHLSGVGEAGNGTSDLNKVTRDGPLGLVKSGNWPVLNENGIPPAENFIIIGPQTSGGFYNATRNRSLIEYVLETYRADPNRVYVLGLSAGGYGVWGVVGGSPDIVTAGIAIAGSGRAVESNACDWKDVPVWAFHGDADNQVGISGSIRPVNAVNACNPPPNPRAKLTVYPGAGHNTWSRTYNLSGMGTESSDYDPFDMSIYDWLLQYSNDSSSPTADAGGNKNITLPTNSVVLNGSGTDPDGSITAYKWVKLSGPTATLQNNTTATLTVQNMHAGNYSFELTVTDNDGNKDSDVTQVVVNPEIVNQAPTVNVSNLTITLPTNSTNIVSTANDTDGTVVLYMWQQLTGPTTGVNISGTATNTLSLSNLTEGTYNFRITVTDDDDATASAEVRLIVNPVVINIPPSAEAGGNQSLSLPTNSTTLPGSGSDPDGSIASYLWEKISGPSVTLNNITLPTLSISNLLEGVYIFRLTVTDNDGATASDNVQVTVLAANQNPVANCGDNITLTLPTNSTTLTGSGTDADGSIATYLWEKTSGPTATISNTGNATTNISNLSEGVYTFQLTVTDNDGASDVDQVTVTVQTAIINQPPTVSVENDKFITLPTNSLTLNGTATDIDGNITLYLWEVISGPATYTLTNQSTPNLTISNLIEGTYTLRFTATDNDDASNSDNIKITVSPENINQAPTSNAGGNKNITLPTSSAIFNGSGNDSDGSIASYLWSQISGPSSATLSGENTATLSVSNLVEGVYTFQLLVTDNDDAIDTDDVIITVSAANQPPEVAAGDDVTLNLPTNSVNIQGTATDSDGTIASTNWVQINGPVVTMNITGTTLNLSNMTEGTYRYRFSAIDNNGASSFDDMRVYVIASNQLPNVNAGTNITVQLPINSSNITAVASDTDGTIDAYSWTKESGPNVTLVNDDSRTVTLNNLVEGVYNFSVTVTDNDGGTASDNVIVTVLAAAVNKLPVANAGMNIGISLPTNSTNIVGAGSDPDGEIVSYLWTKRSGPSATITNASSSTVSVSSLVEGVYTFRLTVTDNNSDSGFDEVLVIVNSAASNQNPVANAGDNIQIILPLNSTTITGSGFDADGNIASYLWTQTAGPNSATLIGTTIATLSVSNLIEGTYTFNLRVTDDDDATSNDAVNVIVLSESANNPPIANAGANQLISLPNNTVVLNGSGSDSDGSIASYSWTKVSGPQANLENANTSSLTLTSLVEGNYKFRLTVTDDGGLAASDEVDLQVLAATVNQAPTVSAGQDFTIQLPTNSTSITGSASDVDGTIILYEWVQVNGNSITLNDTDKPKLKVTNLTEGDYTFKLSVTDDLGSTATDEMILTVISENTNLAPIANAGNDADIILPTNSTTLDGTLSRDSDGTIVSYLWSKISGPNATLSNQNESIANVTNLLEGTYLFRLTITDNDDAQHFDDVILNVIPESVNQNPIANAGSFVSIIEPESTATLTGSATDPDGTIENIIWTLVSGPNTPELVGENSFELTANNLIIGIYTFELTVEDDVGAQDSDQTKLTVIAEDEIFTSSPPIANAGEDVNLVIPNNSLNLAGSVSSENLVTFFQWRQLSGKPIAGMPADTIAATIDNIELGRYVFEFYVEDVGGQKDTDEITVIVSDGIDNNDFPKVFTPNGDGQNDTWIIEDLTKVENCELVIFDKFGNKVYAAFPYDNTWNGTFKGSDVATGAYYYVFKCDGVENYSGGIRIIR